MSERDVIDKGLHLATNFTPHPPPPKKDRFYSSSICADMTLTRETPQTISYTSDNWNLVKSQLTYFGNITKEYDRRSQHGFYSHNIANCAVRFLGRVYWNTPKRNATTLSCLLSAYHPLWRKQRRNSHASTCLIYTKLQATVLTRSVSLVPTKLSATLMTTQV